MIAEPLRPILYSADVRRSIEYYTQKLGFTDKWEWMDPPTFGGVVFGHFELLFCKDGQGQPGTWIYMFVKNVDEYYEKIKASGANILETPQNMPWDIREMLVEDPDGHKIRIGTRL